MKVRLQNISSQIFTHRRPLLFGLVLILVFAFIPLSIAHAGFWDGVINVVVGIVAKFFELIQGILGAIFKTLSTVLMEIIKYFLGMTVTPGAPKTPSFVETSFNFVRGVVNMFFILILVFIGLATILRLQNYQYQKTLPWLLIMALLVNFSGVFVGFIVDMSNLVAHFFLEKATGTWGDAFKSLTSVSVDPTQKLATAIASIIYYFVAILIYFVLILVFAVRTMILWVAVILAPLAFASYVLPATKGKIWDEWWKQLLQWSIFAIPVAFFMFLANAALTGVDNAPPEGSISGFTGFMAPFTALFILYLGVITSQAMAPKFANTVADFGKKWGLRGAMATGSFAWRQTGERFNAGEKGEKIRKWGETMGVAPVGAGLLRRGFATGIKYGPGLLTRWAGRGVELGSKELAMRVGNKDEREFQEGLKEVTNKDSFMVFNMVNEELAKGLLANRNRILGLLNGIRNRGDGDDIEDALFKDDAPVKLDKKVIGQAVKTGLRVGPPGFRPLLKSFYAQAMLHPEEFGFNATSTRDEKTGELTFTGRDADFLARQYKSVPTKFNAQDFQGDTIAPKNFDMNTGEGKFFIETMIKERGADFMGQIARRPRKAESIAAMEYIFKEGAHAQDGLGIDWLLDNNAEDVLRYLDSPGARSLGLGRDITRDEIEEQIEAHRAEQTPRKLLERKVHLEQQRDDPTISPRRQRTVKHQIAQIEATMADIGRSPEDLEAEVTRLQSEVARVDAIPDRDLQTQPEAVQSKVAAQNRIRQIQQNLRGMGRERPVQEQIAEDLTGIRTRLQARTQELRNLISNAQQAGVLDFIRTNIPVWQAELAGIPNRIQEVETALQQIEGLKVPEPPAPLQKIQPDMPSQLQGSIDSGNKIVQGINELTKEMQKSLGGIHDTNTDLNNVFQTMENLQNQITELNQQEQAGALTPELQTQRNELQSQLQELTQTRRELGEAIQQQTETVIRTKEDIESRKTDLEDVRHRIAPLYEEYEARKTRVQAEKRIRQRRQRR